MKITSSSDLRFACLGALIVGAWAAVNPFVPRPFPADAAKSAGRPAPADSRSYTLLFAGDVMLSRTVGARMAAQHDWTLPFQLIRDTLRQADLRYCNLECPVSDRGRNLHHIYSFRADPRVLAGLKFADFNVVSLANNHAYDWGPESLLDSLARLCNAGIRSVGAGPTALAAHHPVVVDLHGLRLAFLAYVNIDPREATAGANRPGVAWLDLPQVLEDIRLARPLADLVIVCPHWGVEYALEPAPEQVEMAHRIIDAGADMIVGSHPHVVQPVEIYRGHWIAYSLGNFIFDQHDRPTHRGLLLKATVRGKTIADVAAIPIDINPRYQASLAPPPPAACTLVSGLNSKTAPTTKYVDTLRNTGGDSVPAR